MIKNEQDLSDLDFGKKFSIDEFEVMVFLIIVMDFSCYLKFTLL